jgi:hypothetical protein
VHGILVGSGAATQRAGVCVVPLLLVGRTGSQRSIAASGRCKPRYVAARVGRPHEIRQIYCGHDGTCASVRSHKPPWVWEVRRAFDALPQRGNGWEQGRRWRRSAESGQHAARHGSGGFRVLLGQGKVWPWPDVDPRWRGRGSARRAEAKTLGGTGWPVPAR